MFLNAHYTCFLPILHGTFFANARPIDSTSLSISPRATRYLESIELVGKTYDLIPFPESYQGEHSDFYEVVDASPMPLVLKVIENTGDEVGERVQKEIDYSIMVNLFWAREKDNLFHYLALKDVRKRYPRPNSPPLKLFHEWYLKYHNIKIDVALAKLQEQTRRSLLRFFVEKGLHYTDISLENIYTTKNFDVVMPVNWAPPKSTGDRGVLNVGLDISRDQQAQNNYRNELGYIISRQMNIEKLQEVLRRHGEKLRIKDVRIRNRIKLDGKEYQITPLTMQGRFSRTYTLTDGFAQDDGRVPAVLKIVEGGHENKANWKTEKEIRYLQTVKLYLTHETDDDFFYIVMKDVRMGFPKKKSPPLRPFREWYMEDKNMDVEESLQKFRKAVKKRLLKFAEKDNLLYNDFHFNNIFVDQKLKVVMPIDWGPPEYIPGARISGVEEITTQNRKERKKVTQVFEEYLETTLSKRFSLNAFGPLVAG